MKLRTCDQCGRYYRYHRSTSRFCSDKCRQQNKRGIEPVKWWRGVENADVAGQFLAELLAAHPAAHKQLQALRDRYGSGAFNDFVRVLMSVVEMTSKD